MLLQGPPCAHGVVGTPHGEVCDIFIALFTTKAEYMATSHYTKEAVWLRQLLADVRYVHARRTGVHHVRQSRMHNNCKESYTPFLHQIYRYTT